MPATGPKFSKTGREEVLALVARLDRQGYTQFEITKRVYSEFRKEISQSSISMYLKLIRERYMIEQNKEREESIAEKVEQLREVRKEAYEAWERSKQGLERITAEYKRPIIIGEPDKKGQQKSRVREIQHALQEVKRIVLKEGRSGAGEFLHIVMETLKQERELLGLDAPKRMDVTGKFVQVNWDAELAPVDTLDRELQEIEGMVLPPHVPSPSTQSSPSSNGHSSNNGQGH